MKKCCFILPDHSLCTNEVRGRKSFSCRYHRNTINRTYENFLSCLMTLMKRNKFKYPRVTSVLHIKKHILIHSKHIIHKVNQMVGCTGWITNNQQEQKHLTVLTRGASHVGPRMNPLIETYNTFFPQTNTEDNLWYNIGCLIAQNTICHEEPVYSTQDCLVFVWNTLFSNNIISRLAS